MDGIPVRISSRVLCVRVGEVKVVGFYFETAVVCVPVKKQRVDEGKCSPGF